MTPLPIKDAPTINVANRNEGPNLFLGIKVIGPFLRNLVTPKVADRTLVANVARKNQSVGFIETVTKNLTQNQKHVHCEKSTIFLQIS